MSRSRVSTSRLAAAVAAVAAPAALAATAAPAYATKFWYANPYVQNKCEAVDTEIWGGDHKAYGFKDSAGASKNCNGGASKGWVSAQLWNPATSSRWSTGAGDGGVRVSVLNLPTAAYWYPNCTHLGYVHQHILNCNSWWYASP